MTALLGDLTAIDGVHIERPGVVTVTEPGNTVRGATSSGPRDRLVTPMT